MAFKLKSGNSPLFKHIGSNSPLRVVPDPAGQNYPSRRDENRLKRDLEQSQRLDKLKENLLKQDAERKEDRNKPLTDWMIEDLLRQGVKVKDMPRKQQMAVKASMAEESPAKMKKAPTKMKKESSMKMKKKSPTKGLYDNIKAGVSAAAEGAKYGLGAAYRYGKKGYQASKEKDKKKKKEGTKNS